MNRLLLALLFGMLISCSSHDAPINPGDIQDDGKVYDGGIYIIENGDTTDLKGANLTVSGTCPTYVNLYSTGISCFNPCIVDGFKFEILDPIEEPWNSDASPVKWNYQEQDTALRNLLDGRNIYEQTLVITPGESTNAGSICTFSVFAMGGSRGGYMDIAPRFIAHFKVKRIM